MGPLQVLFFLLLKSSIARSNNQCPNSFCGNNTFPIQYPFSLEGQQTQDSCDYTDVKCNNTQSILILNLPFSRDLYISHIDYDSSTVEIYDPNKCLARRLMSLNLQDSPFVAKDCQNTTFYDCPPDAVRSNFTAIECLSNFTNFVVATSYVSSQVMEESYGCGVISTSLLPLSSFDWGFFDWNNNNNSLVLTWYVPACEDCSKKQGGWKTISKFIAIVLMLPAVAMLLVILFLLIACCVQTVEDFMRERANVTAHESAIAQITTLSTIFITAPSADEVGLDESRIKSCSELVVQDINDDKCINKGLGENNSCPICLELYGVKEKVRRINLCQHCFHADCIDQWLQTNSTCPICRFSLLDVKL